MCTVYVQLFKYISYAIYTAASFSYLYIIGVVFSVSIPARGISTHGIQMIDKPIDRTIKMSYNIFNMSSVFELENQEADDCVVVHDFPI